MGYSRAGLGCADCGGRCAGRTGLGLSIATTTGMKLPRIPAQTTAAPSLMAPSAPVMTVSVPQSPTGYGPFDSVVDTLQQIAQAAGAAAGSSGSGTLARIAQAANQAASDITGAVQTIDGAVIYGGVAPTPAAAGATLMQQLRTFIGTPEGKIVAGLAGLWLARRVLR